MYQSLMADLVDAIGLHDIAVGNNTAAHGGGCVAEGVIAAGTVEHLPLAIGGVFVAFDQVPRAVHQAQHVVVGILQRVIAAPTGRAGRVSVDAGLNGFVDVRQAPDVVLDGLVAAVAFFDDALAGEIIVVGAIEVARAGESKAETTRLRRRRMDLLGHPKIVEVP